MEYERILALVDDDKIELAKSFKDEIGKKLALGMTKYVCQNGTLSDGHEKVTDAQRYFQSIKEMYYLSLEIENQRVRAMEAQADYMDAMEHLEVVKKPSARLRAEAKLLKAKTALTSCLVEIEDKKRCLNAFNEVREQLQEEVESKYPEGIEQAEPDNWKAVAQYRIYKKKLGLPQELTHVPLPADEKAALGLSHGSPEMAVWLGLNNPRKLKELQEKNPASLPEGMVK